MNKKLFVCIPVLSILLNIYLGAGLYWLKVKDNGFKAVASAMTHIPADVLIGAFFKEGYTDFTEMYRQSEPLPEGIVQIVLMKDFLSVRIRQDSSNDIQDVKIESLVEQ